MDDFKKRQSDKLAELARRRNELISSESNVFDHTLRDSDKMEVKSGDHWQAQLDAKRKAARISRGLPAEVAENVYDAGDYKKQMMKGGKEVLKDARKGIKSLSKGFKSLGIPVISSLAALASGDASAAIPGLDAATETGPDRNSPQGRIESGEATDREKMEMSQRRGKGYVNSQAKQDFLLKQQEQKQENRLAALEKLRKIK